MSLTLAAAAPHTAPDRAFLAVTAGGTWFPGPRPTDQAPEDRPTADDETETDAVARRIEEWWPGLRPAGPQGEWLAAQAVVASVRIDACQRDQAALRGRLARRAAVCWEADRRLAAEVLGERLGRKPARIARQLEQTRQGCDWMLERWAVLLAVLEQGRDWDDGQRRLALDLLGTPAELRGAPGRLDLAVPSAADPLGALKAVARSEVDRLSALRRDVLDPLDAGDRAAAEAGIEVVPDRDLARLRRLEGSLLRSLTFACKAVEAGRPAPAPAPFDESAARYETPGWRSAAPEAAGPVGAEAAARELASPFLQKLIGFGQTGRSIPAPAPALPATRPAGASSSDPDVRGNRRWRRAQERKLRPR